jgi:AmmeMemoRadiSam system protein B
MITRAPAVAGSFYPGSPNQLRCEIEGYLQQEQSAAGAGSKPQALIVPHAGYYFSGAVAADAYRLVADEEFDLVVVLAPSHHHYFTGASIYSIGNYETPLGEVKVDCGLAESLIAQYPMINFVAEAHRLEHSLEVQLPFLQVVLGDFTLLPLVLGEQSWSQAEALAEIIAGLAENRHLLLIASTDLSHFHDCLTAKSLDRRVVDAVAAFDPEAFWSLIENRQAEACGAGPLLTVMLATLKLKGQQAEILTYRHSGMVSGDHDRVVGYLAAALY